ncbi:class I adenylate-forming enzyme family protein [Gordonia humi]|uniref:class I adenylate-forming enzyme family protein n=1 Tax=Gordonia humi TaxID=686429 RepID=UPI00361C3541
MRPRWGAFKVGAIVAPFNHRMVPRELAELVADCEPAVVYCDAASRPRIDEVAADGRFSVLAFAETVTPLRAGGRPPAARLSPDLASPTAIVFTSGTTGRPKGVIFTHASIAGVMHDWMLMESVTPGRLRPLLVLPLFTAGGLVWGVCRTIHGGGTLLLQPGFDPAEALRVLVEEKADTFTGPPILFEQIAKVPDFADADLSHVTTAHVGGAPVPVALFEQWRPRGVLLRQLYGQTEIGGSATVTVNADAPGHPEKCGRGTVFTRIRVVDSDGVDCPAGTPGEIMLRGPGMTPGYWRNEEATASTLVDGWLRTGDLGVLDDTGRLTYVDRIKELIISGGLNISPAEIETVISGLDGVIEVAVLAAADEKFGQTPAAIVVARDGVTAEAIVAHCTERLADYKVPRYVVVSTEPLPRMASGKIDKHVLRAEHADIADTHERVR